VVGPHTRPSWKKTGPSYPNPIKTLYTDLLQLTSISLAQFKNYLQQQVAFTERIVCITGSNGIGKTNLLDAIYYLCFTRSYFSSLESLNTSFGQEGFRLDGTFKRQDAQECVRCIYRNGKKEVLLDGTAYDRLSQHLGRFPAVIIAPDDAALISGGSEGRRRFLDTLLAQVDPSYLQDLIAYQKVLQQRNSLLRQWGGHLLNPDLLDVLDQRLAAHGQQIYIQRNAFFPALGQKAVQFYREISHSEEKVELIYQSGLHESALLASLKQARERDLRQQRTGPGIHRDDLIMHLNGHPARQTASQGQRKNLLFALKLAQYELLREHKGFPPLLLLDDVFEKLDHARITHLINLICGENFGQVFITDTEEERLQQAFAGSSRQPQMIRLG
jgi:DNA replication and repair protein RecF